METTLLLVLGYATFAFFTAEIAKRKNRPVYFWAMLGVLFGLGALITIAILPKRSTSSNVKPENTPLQPQLDLTPDVWYYLDSKHQTKGPVSFTRLKQLVLTGEIERRAYVWHESMDQWQRINQNVALLQALLQTNASQKQTS